MKPLVSIVVPVYNVGEYVGECLNSLQVQSYENIEIIIVDDGSTDESGVLCDKFAKKEPRARVYHTKNGGLSQARNYGIKKAKGEYLAFVDSDDYVRKNFIAEMCKMVTRDGVDVAVVGYNDEVPRAEIISGVDAATRLLINQNNLEIVTWNKMYAKSLFDGIEFPVGKKHEDTLTTYKLLARAEKVGYVAKSLYVYREREESIMGEGDVVGRLAMREKAAKEAIEYFGYDDDLKEAAEVSLLLAKYAYVDAMIRGEINTQYGEVAMNWVLAHGQDYRGNKYMTKKLRLYNMLMKARLYKSFRRIV